MKRQANNYFHVRVYTERGNKIELFRERTKASTLREIIDGLKQAVVILEKFEQPAQQETHE